MQNEDKFTDLSVKSKKYRPKYWLHILLFFLSLITTTIAGAEMVTNKSLLRLAEIPSSKYLNLSDLWQGLRYSIPFLLFLTFHEFGHYFTARYHKVKSTLPFYIPVYIPGFFNIGSFGAVIRILQHPPSNKKYFDIGIAGPIAGFIVSIILLVYGFLTLPPLEYLYEMNPNYLTDFGHIPSTQEILDKYGSALEIGDSLIFWIFENVFADPSRVPNHFEYIHYPFIFVGYLTLFFTALNLLPIGQLDGGHVTYALFGRKRAGLISRIMVIFLIFFGGMGIAEVMQDSFWFLYLGFYGMFLVYIFSRIYGKSEVKMILISVAVMLISQFLVKQIYPKAQINMIWLLYSFMAVRFIRLDHPPARIEQKLDKKRQILGWFALLIFVLCFSIEPIRITMQ